MVMARRVPVLPRRSDQVPDNRVPAAPESCKIEREASEKK